MVLRQHSSIWSAPALASSGQKIGNLYLLFSSIAMSRCFPFPPPGYELKGGPDDVDAIIKEKEKHKKHKDKREKNDKKEKSERKKKERGGEKHRDKRDKKRKREKDRDKKDKNKDIEKKVGPLESQNDLKPVPYSEPTDRIQDERTAVELGNRVKNDGSMGVQTVQKVTILERQKTNLSDKVQENDDGRLGIKDLRDRSRTANCQSFQVDSRSLGNGRNSYGENQIKIEEGKERNGYEYRIGTGEGGTSMNADQNKNVKAEDKKGKEENKRELTGFRNCEVKQNTSNVNLLDFHSKIPSDLLKENNDCQGKLPKLKELNGFLHAKDSGVRLNNISRHTIASDQVDQTGTGIRPCRNTNNIGVVGKRAVITDENKVNGKLSSPQSVIDNVRNIGPCQTSADNRKTENGRVHIDSHVVSNGVISPHIVRIQRKMEPCQTSKNVAMAKQINSSFDQKVPSSHPHVEMGGKMAVQALDANHMRMHTNDSRISGSLEGKKHYSSRKLKVTTTTNTKPPHPDVKYLSQILTVPEVEWPQSDNQEWLFDRQDSETKRPKLASPETKYVWSEAIHLKSSDVTALPYVIPY
ncbi:uncharacterized protein LOC121743433 [Salvia splendens]|uniref:uncharacterized protein LOC121743433 n=1 Tax=Salvia splendens TaxID=180675 RepID=UPI001C280C5C|nr:uncharacterized protein LOC121743433 [Salvia splendens]